MSPGATMERVYAELKARAMGGRFAPGARLDPVLLARDLSSSATPVRDALHRLSGERLIESWHHIGFRQPVHSETDLRDLYAWTALLLGLALRAPSAAAAGLAVPPCSEDYAARVAQLFRTIAMLSDNHELRQALGNAVERSQMLRAAERTSDSGCLEAVADMERDLDASRWPELRRGIAMFHRRRAATAARVAHLLRPPELQR